MLEIQRVMCIGIAKKIVDELCNIFSPLRWSVVDGSDYTYIYI